MMEHFYTHLRVLSDVPDEIMHETRQMQSQSAVHLSLDKGQSDVYLKLEIYQDGC